MWNDKREVVRTSVLIHHLEGSLPPVVRARTLSWFIFPLEGSAFSAAGFALDLFRAATEQSRHSFGSAAVAAITQLPYSRHLLPP